MAIQWFPGHMHKARKEIARVVPATDVIIEVLDARIPYSSENPMLAELRGNKPCLKVLTKADLADPQTTRIWLDDLAESCVKAVAVNAYDTQTILELPEHFKSLLTINRQRIKPYVAMVVGIPNTGKSTLINILAGRTAAKTGNEPAITKRQQQISLGNHWVLRDTPGVMWPNVDNPASGFRLAATGAIRDTAMDSSEVAVHLLDFLCAHYPSALLQRYNQKLPLVDSVQTLEAIGHSRGCLGAGGMVDFDRAARLLLTEFRGGKLGPVSLETPAMKKTEIEQVAAEKIIRDARRKQKRAKKQPSQRKH